MTLAKKITFQEQTKNGKLSKKRQLVLDCFGDDSILTIKDISKETKLQLHEVSGRVSELTELGLIKVIDTLKIKGGRSLSLYCKTNELEQKVLVEKVALDKAIKAFKKALSFPFISKNTEKFLKNDLDNARKDFETKLYVIAIFEGIKEILNIEATELQRHAVKINDISLSDAKRIFIGLATELTGKGAIAFADTLGQSKSNCIKLNQRYKAEYAYNFEFKELSDSVKNSALIAFNRLNKL